MDGLGRKGAKGQHCGMEYQDMTIMHNRKNTLDKDTAKFVSTSDRHKDKDLTSHK